jgi:hypothetical protein
MPRPLQTLFSLFLIAVLFASCRPDEGVVVDADIDRMRDSLLAAVQPGQFEARIFDADEREGLDREPMLQEMARGEAVFESMPGAADDNLTVRILLGANGAGMPSPAPGPGSIEPAPGPNGDPFGPGDAQMERTQAQEMPDDPAGDPYRTPQHDDLALDDDIEIVITWETGQDVISLQELEDRAPEDVRQVDRDTQPNVRAHVRIGGREYTSIDGQFEITDITADRVRGTFVFEIPEGAPGDAPGDRRRTAPGEGQAQPLQPGQEGEARPMQPGREGQTQQPGTGAQPDPVPPETDRDRAVTPPPQDGFHERDIRSRLVVGAFDARRAN